MPRETKETKDLAPALPVSKELLDQLVSGPMTPEQFETMFRGLKKAMLERALGAELTHHLGTDNEQGSARRNHRNGTTPKTVITDDGAVRLEVPRDRTGTFEPQLLGKHERRFEGCDDKIIATYARGMT